jgi:hypothetical protein
MRTTLDLPDDVFRLTKATAARKGMKLKDLLADFVIQGLSSLETPSLRHKKPPLPEFLPKTGQPLPLLTNADIEDILRRADLEGLEND